MWIDGSSLLGTFPRLRFLSEGLYFSVLILVILKVRLGFLWFI